MKINWSPRVGAEPIRTLSVKGQAITINGEVFDFGPMDDGSVLPREAIQSEFIAGDVFRHGSQIELTLYANYMDDFLASREVKFANETPTVVSAGTVRVPGAEQ